MINATVRIVSSDTGCAVHYRNGSDFRWPGGSVRSADEEGDEGRGEKQLKRPEKRARPAGDDHRHVEQRRTACRDRRADQPHPGEFPEEVGERQPEMDATKAVSQRAVGSRRPLQRKAHEEQHPGSKHALGETALTAPTPAEPYGCMASTSENASTSRCAPRTVG